MFDSPTLVIETATSACSVALFRDRALVAAVHDEIGRGHAERLMGIIAALPDGGRAAHILVSCGPGSFTGIRVGVAAARALGLGWGCPVQGYATLAAVAAEALASDADASQICVLMHGGHGEAFVQRFRRAPFAMIDAVASVPLRDVALLPADDAVVGTAVEAIGSALGRVRVIDYRLSATSAQLLPIDQLQSPIPIYGRGADATPML